MYQVGESNVITVQATAEMVREYAEVSGDYNPIHLDKEAAIGAGFPGEIVHGMLTMGISSRLFVPYIQSGYKIRSFQVKFKSPLLVGKNINVSSKIEKIDNEELYLLVKGETDGQEIIDGSAHLRKT